MTTPAMTGPANNAARWLSNAGIILFAYFSTALIPLHVLRPNYGPRGHFISDYAVGPWGWIMTTAFLALSGGCLSLALGLLRGGPAPTAARLGAAVLAIAAIGLVVTAIFPTDLPGGPYTRSGDIHEMSFRVNGGVAFGRRGWCLVWAPSWSRSTPRSIGFDRTPCTESRQIPKGCGAECRAEGVIEIDQLRRGWLAEARARS